MRDVIRFLLYHCELESYLHRGIGGIDSSISARGPVSTQHAQLVAQTQALALRGAVTARAHVGSVPASTAAGSEQQQQQRNESSASNRQQPSVAAAQRRESTAATEDADSGDDSAWESGSLRPSQALRRYAEYLTPFEQSEILDFPEVHSQYGARVPALDWLCSLLLGKLNFPAQSQSSITSATRGTRKS